MIPKILIVDDSSEFRKTVRGYLEKQDLRTEIIEANSGEMAIAKAIEEKPEIIIMDVWLPHLNGMDAAERIKNEKIDTQIIVVTMFDTEEFKKSYRKNHIVDFIGKTELYDRLMPLIHKCLKERRNRYVHQNKNGS